MYTVFTLILISTHYVYLLKSPHLFFRRSYVKRQLRFLGLKKKKNRECVTSHPGVRHWSMHQCMARCVGHQSS